MVLESLVALLVDKYLGEYIENFDSNKLKIDLWNGNVVLENLYLKPNAFANFNLPITVITGYLQKLLLHISWKHVYTHPIKITVDGLYLLLAPNTEIKYDPERDEKEQYDAKMKEVHKIEDFRKEREAYENSETSHMHKDTFLERLQLHIIRNLELSINNIHIAYEDKITKPGHPFTFGITLNYVKLCTTNAEWEPEVSKEDSPVVYKFADLNTLSIYWNSDAKSRSELARENVVDDLHAKIVRNEQTAPEYITSIVRPLNMKAKLKIATTPRQQDFAHPVLDADIDLEAISLNINRNQYSDLLDLLELQDNLNLKSKYIKYHAVIEADDLEKPSLRRWKFAYAAIIHEQVRPQITRNKWQNIKETLDRCREYRTLHFQELSGQANKEQTKRSRELEKYLDVFNLIYVRRTAEIEVKKKKAEQKQMSWWDRLGSWWSSDSNHDNPELHFQNVMTVDEKKKLYDAIGYEDNETSSLSAPADYVDIDLSIRLNTLEVNVNENDSQFKVIAHVAVPNTSLIFKRRPAAPGFLLVVDLDSLQMCGIAETANQAAPVLIQSVNRSQSPDEKFLHIEFESNPSEKKLDYRIRAISQSLEITYHALTINQLVECFVPDKHRDLEGIKQAAYSFYTDIKHRTQFLLSYNLKKIKALDIDIDLQSSYFLLPENGVYRDGCAVICLDFGQFTFQNGPNGNEPGNTPDIEDAGQSSYIPLELRLKNVQLIYATQSEDWKNARKEQDSRAHLIKPITVGVNVFKCIYLDNVSLPIWKADAQISPIDARLSDRRLLGIGKLYQSIPLPQSNELAVEKSPSFESEVPRRSTKQTYEAVENMTPVMKILHEASNAKEQERTDEQAKEVDSQGQLTELVATLELPRIDLLIEESLSDMIDHTQPFVRLSLVTFTARTTIKTFDVEFHASLADILIFHEQFLTKNDDRLRLFAAERQTLINVKCLLTSPLNPLFSSSPYYGIENKIYLHIDKSVLMLSLEALQSIVRFQNDLTEKLSNEQQEPKTKTNASTSNKVAEKKPQSPMSTFQIDVDLEGFRAFIGTQFSQLLDIQLENLQANVSQSAKKSSAHLILRDFRVLDIHTQARHRTIIAQQTHGEPLLRIDLSLVHYPKKYQKKLDDIDGEIKGQLTKINIVFLYKHLDLILNVLNGFQTKKTQSHPSSSQTSTHAETIQKWQEQDFRLRFDIILNAPTILVPTNSHSNEGVSLDLGQLTARTHFSDDPNRSLVEQQVVILKNVSASRVQLNNNDEIIGDVLLLECAQLNTSIDRFLHSEKVNNEANISIKVQWDTIELTLGKDDYVCLTAISKENFSEKIRRKIPDEQTNEDQVESSVPTDSSDDRVSETIRIDVQMKKIAVTLDLGESDINAHRASRKENSKLTNVRIEMVEGYFRQLSDASYDAKVQIQDFFLDDLRRTNQPDSITRLMDRNLNVDSNAPVLMATLEFQPKNKTRTMATRQVKALLESLYICISPDYLVALKDFFNSSSSADSETKPHRTIPSRQTPSDVPDDLPLPAKPMSTHRESTSVSPSSQKASMAQSESRCDVETKVDVTIKTPQIILLEDQHNANSHCLVLGFAFQMHLIRMDVDTKLSGSVQDLTIYGSNFAELKKESKIKYHILQPTKIESVLIMNSDEQKIDLRIGNISVYVTPAAIHTVITVINSMGKHQVDNQAEKEKIQSETLFDPKPFKDASFWFIEDPEEKQEMLEQTDILEVTTGTPSQKKTVIEEDNKQKEKEKIIQTGKIRSQQIILNLDIVEIALQLGSGSATKSVVAICLSNLFADVKNWSTDLTVSSKIQVELALFNDHILAWEPLIEPIIDERGSVISPWCITCSTMANEDDGNENESRFLLDDPKSSSTNEQRKEGATSLNAKTVIYIRAEHMLHITLTKATLDLAQRLSAMLNDAYTKQLSSNEAGDESMLSVHNQTGYDIFIDEIVGVELVKNKSSETSLNLKHNESVSLTVPGERLSATHLPAIAEQVAKRRQQFSVKIDNHVSTVDINQTWRRVYELGASPIPDWPIQMLCDSQIYHDRRRVILSSIVKICNRTIMPLVLLDVDAVEEHKFHQVARIEVNEELYLPIDLLYMRMTPRLYFAIDEDHSTEQLRDFISFGWPTESTIDRIVKIKNGKEAHVVVYKEAIDAYSENTDEPLRTAFHIYVKLALHLVNLLPIDVQCLIDDSLEQIDLKPSELYHSTSGHKKSLLTFTIPSYNNAVWVSEPIDLNTKGHGKHNEHMVTFHDVLTQETLRMVLRVDTYRASYRASLYSPFWIVNCTNLKFEFKIEKDKTFIDVVDQPYFVCPKKFDSEEHKKKGHIRLYSIEEDETRSEWSEHFSLDVIKSTGMTICKVSNDRLYTICVDIVTCSFGMTKIVTLAPSMAVINNSTLEIEVVEMVSVTEQDNWKSVKPEEIVPFWPRDVKDGLMCVRYAHDRVSSPGFLMNDKHRTLLHMNDEDHPALHVEVSTTDFDGIHIVFSDYTTGDAPVLLVNCLKNQPVTFCQAETVRTQILPPQHYVYYTWIDPLQPGKLAVSCNGPHATIELNPQCGTLETEDEQRVYYAIFHDGPQTILIFSEETSIIEAVSNMAALSEPMSQYIQIGIRDIGIAIVNDINRDDLFYISINKSKDIWTETRKSLVKPLSHDLNQHLEEHYKTHIKHQKTNPNEEKLVQKKYHIDKHRDVSFKEDTAELTDHDGHRMPVKRQALDGLWIGYAWSVSNAALHLRVSHIQIDDQLENTMFPVVLHPIVSKAAGTDNPGKPFIELSIFQSKEARSNTMHFKYFKLLIQEFVFCVDQGLIVSIFAFIKSEKELAAPTVNMDADLKRIEKPLQTIVKAEADNRSGESHIYFDDIHLSPLKIHVSFSIHGAKPSEQLLAEYPLADFLLQMLNVAEVQDVILKLNFYERKHDRFTITKLTTEIKNHYQNQFLKQLHVVVLGLDVLGNPFGVLRGVAEGVESFFYEPYQGAMEGPIEFIEGIASGTRNLVGSVVGGAAGAVSKVTGVISKGLATLTLDEDYKNARIQRKELITPGTPDVVSSGKNTVKDVVHAAKDVVKKPVAGAKESGTSGFVKGLGKGFLGLVARPASGVADLTSTSFDLIKRTATHEEVVHRVRHPRHIGRDGIVRPSTAHEAMGFYIFNRLDIEKYTKSDAYIAHINCSENQSGWLLATTKHLLFVTERSSSSGIYEVEWHFRYKELKGAPVVKFDPNQIEIILKEPKIFGRTNKDRPHDEKLVTYNNVGEARYIVDKITETMHAMEV